MLFCINMDIAVNGDTAVNAGIPVKPGFGVSSRDFFGKLKFFTLI